MKEKFKNLKVNIFSHCTNSNAHYTAGGTVSIKYFKVNKRKPKKTKLIEFLV